MTATACACHHILVAAALVHCAAAADMFAVFRSTDRGQSWTRSDSGIPARSRVNAFGSTEAVLFVGSDAGIFSSKDQALNWQPATGVAMSSGRIISLAASGRNVYAGTDGSGLLVSRDGGESWTADHTFPAKKVRCLLSHDGKVYAGTDSNGVFALDHAGQSWRHLSAGFPSDAQVFALSMAGGKLFAGLYSRGLFAWTEQTGSWAKTGTVTPLALASIQNTLIAGHNPGGLWWSGDSGVSWKLGVAESGGGNPLESLFSADSGELSSEAPVWDASADESLIFAGAAVGIYYSADRGRTWRRARKGLPEKSPGIAFLLNRDLILAGTVINESTGESE